MQFLRTYSIKVTRLPLVAPSQSVHRRQRLGGMLNFYHRAAA
jgi:hypothetical protein